MPRPIRLLSLLGSLSLLACSLVLASGAAFADAAPTAGSAPAPAPDIRSARGHMAPGDLALYDRLSARVESAYDTVLGGYVNKAGAPSESAIELALRNGADGEGSYWTDHALATAHWTIGLYDSVGGGFVDRARDADRSEPYFDKSTAVNSRRLEMALLVGEVSGDPTYRRVAAHTADFFDHVLLDGRGGFVPGQAGDRELMPLANGYAIHAWWTWAAASADPRIRDFAHKSIDAVWAHCWAPEGVFLRRGTFGDLLTVPQLDDQVEMGRALVLAARIGGRADDRVRATLVGEVLLEHFEDHEKGGFRTHAVPAKDGHIRKAARLDDENARAARFLAELADLTGDEKYRTAARRTLRAFDERFDKLGLEAADWALAVRALSVSEFPAAPAWASALSEVYKAPRSKTYKTRGR